MATRKTRSPKTPPKVKPTPATNKATGAPVDASDVTEAPLTPADMPEATSVGDAPTTGEMEAEDQPLAELPDHTIDAEAALVVQGASPEQPERDLLHDSVHEKSAGDVGTAADAGGQRITRTYKGVEHVVTVSVTGQVEYAGTSYSSLTACAQVITGQKHLSGPKFFGLAGSRSARGGLTTEERAVQEATRARKAQERAEAKARKEAQKAALAAEREQNAIDVVLEFLEQAAGGGRVGDEQLARLKRLGG